MWHAMSSGEVREDEPAEKPNNIPLLSKMIVRLLLLSLLIIVVPSCLSTTSAASAVVDNDDDEKKKKKNSVVALFGATCTVGSEVLKSLLLELPPSPSSFDQIVLIGRKFPSNIYSLLDSDEDNSSSDVDVDASDNGDEEDDDGIDSNNTRLEIVSLTDLFNLDTNYSQYHPSLLQYTNKIDACIIAVGVSEPMKMLSLQQWYSIEVDMVGSIARYCVNVGGATYINVLSTVDAELQPLPFGFEEIQEGHEEEEVSQQEQKQKPKPIGWITMLKYYFRIKGLEEQAVIEAATTATATAAHAADESKKSKNKIHISLFQPNSIITKELRYGYVDWCIFWIHWILDPILPLPYHSIQVEILGQAMALDAAIQINNNNKKKNVAGKEEEETTTKEEEEEDINNVKVVRYTYNDFMNIINNNNDDAAATASDDNVDDQQGTEESTKEL